jgi:hypothetical protein
MYKKILKELIEENTNTLDFLYSMLDEYNKSMCEWHISYKSDIIRTEAQIEIIMDIQQFIIRKIEENKSNLKIK